MLENINKVYMVDTNIILHSHKAPFVLANDNNITVISEIVIQELDKFKHGNNTINYEAREFIRKLSYGESYDFMNGKGILYVVDKHRILILKSVANNDPSINNNDDMIIRDYETVPKLLGDNKVYKLITNDLIMKMKAQLRNIEVEHYRDDFNNPNIEFKRTFSYYGCFPNKEYFYIDELESLIRDEIGKHINQIHIHEDSGNRHYLYRINEKQFKTFNKRENISIFNITAKNLEQKLLWKHLIESHDQITVVEGRAGTAKTLSALLCAIKLMTIDHKYNKITYIRKTLISGDSFDQIGFLPGSLNEKIKGYLYPLKDNIEFIIKSKNKKKKKWTQEDIDKAIQDFESTYNINYEYMGHLRGRNLSGIIIIDECQNMTVNDIVTILSRISGDHSKVFILGSIKQIDHPFLNKFNNALTFLLNQCGTFSPIQVQGIRLHNVLRGPITDWIETVTQR